MKRIDRLINIVSTWARFIGIVAMWLLLALILSDVLSRVFLHRTLPGNLELSRWLLISLVFMGAAWTLKDEGHIRVNLFSSRLSQRNQQWLLIYLATVGMAVVGFFTFNAGRMLLGSYLAGSLGVSVLRLPLWWSQAPLFIGLILLCLQFGSVIIKNVISLKSVHKSSEGLSPIWFFGLGLFLVGVVIFSFFPPEALHKSLWLVTLVIVILIFCLVGSSLWIFLSLSLAGIFGMLAFSSYPVGPLVSNSLFNTNTNFVLTCLPLFVFMGELLLRSGASERLYSGLKTWVEKIPGGLLHSNILSCTIFAAISGTSAVTCATIASVAVPQLEQLGYDRKISLASLAGAGTLGLLIPPSTVLIIYGAMTSESIGQLFLAGIIPGLILSSLFMCYIVILALLRPSIAPKPMAYSWRERFRGAIGILPIMFLIVMVLGFIYLGIATPTESAAIGAIGSLGILLLYKNMNWKNIMEASKAALRTTCMIMLILSGAMFLSTVFGYLRVPQYVANIIVSADLSKYTVIGIICIVYIVLGCLFEGGSMMVLTLPIMYPLILEMGFDGIWFGILLTILIEAAAITPPVGFNLFVLQNISGESIGSIAKNSFPFFLLMMVAIVILILFPDLPLILPRLMITGS